MQFLTSFQELNSGEFVGIDVIEVTSIPMLSTLASGYPNNTDIESAYRNDFTNLLTELHQVFCSVSTHNNGTETAMEILWMTEPVQNQVFTARIRLFLIVRTIAATKEQAESITNRIANSTGLMLSQHRFSVQPTSVNTIKNLTGRIHIQRISTIVKDERIENLQNSMFPTCYCFDKIEAGMPDLGSIVNSLIEHSNCALSIQLLPTRYAVEESDAISRTTIALDTLSKGVTAQGIGNISFSIADRASETYRYYQSNNNGALFLYNFSVYGSGQAVEEISSKVLAFLAYDAKHSIALKQVSLDNDDIQIQNNITALPWVINELLLQIDRSSYIFSQRGMDAFYRLPYIITAEEASILFRLPLGSARISAGLPVDETDSSSKTYADDLINAGDIKIGFLKSAKSRDSIGISLKDLTKHMLIVGTPGSGKTTFSVRLLDTLWKDHGIPFLVIEPAKNEYRALISSIPDLQVFTPGKNTISPFVINPFVPPKNVRLETYKSTLKTAFSAAVSMTTPLDKIFEESINNCYSDYRWLDTYTSDDRGGVFNIADFIKVFQETFDGIGYTGDARNIGRAGVVRLNSLINLFDNYHSIPIEDILSKPTVIELAAIENNEQKALIIALLLLSILAYVNANYIGEGNLRNLILLEEAHVLLSDNIPQGQGDANPCAIAQSLVKRMLAEIRSYGIGMAIADQSPRKVTTDVVALTDIKLAFRLVEADDKQIIADSINMSDNQQQRLARLKPGEAFIFFNRLDEPEEIILPDYRQDNNIRITISDSDVQKLSTYWSDKRQLLRPYPECAITKYCSLSCDYYRRILAREIARRIYIKHFHTSTNDFEILLKVFANISALIKQELNGEDFSKELLSCVKVHLWRRIRYGTKIPIRDIQIENSLRK